MLPTTASVESETVSKPTALDRQLIRLVRSPLVVAALCIVLGIGVRLHGLDRAYTSDEGYWLQRTVRFGDALLNGNWVGTARSGHPGVTVMWVGLLGIGPSQIHAYAGEYAVSAATLEAVPGAERLLSAGRAAVAVVAAVLLGLAVLLAGRLLGTAGLLGGALLALDPYTIGMTRLLHVDSLLTPLLLVSVLAGLVYWLGGRHWSLLVLSAVSGGLALLTKAPAITLVPFFGLVWLVVGHPWAGGWRAISRAWLAGLAWVTLAVAVYVALWPVLWVWPVYTIVAVAKFAVTIGGAPHLWPNYFLGQPTSGDPGLLFYPVATLLRLGPVATVGLVLLAVLAAGRRLGSRAADDTDMAVEPNDAPDRDGVGGGTVLWLLVFAIVFADVMAIGSKKFDRYMLPALAVLTILGGVGIWALARMLTGRLAAMVVLLALLGQGYWLLSAHPYPIAAYNPLFGGIGTARQAIMVGWGEGLDQTAAFLNRLPNARQLTVSTQYHHVLRPLFVGRTVRVPSTQTVDYYVVYVNMVQRNTVPIPVRAAMASTGPVFTATVDGEPFAWVYRGPFQIASTRDVPGEELDDGDDN
ncbi:MAG: glycosyltransferase family 39 protein [Chloroflexota bacterium]